MPSCIDVLGPVVAGLLTCVQEQLALCGRPVYQAGVVPGGLAPADLCCAPDDGSDAEGQAWVSITSITTAQQEGVGACGIEYVANLTVGVYRCAPTLQDNGDPPSAQDQEDAVMSDLFDAAIIRQAVTCCWPDVAGLDEADWTIGTWTPYGPSGGCRGGTTLVTVRFADCNCN